MNCLGLKSRLLEVLRKQLEETVRNFKAVIEDAQKSANEYGAPKDRYDSFRMQLLRKKDMFSQQLAKVNEQADVLERISIDQELKKVEFGALIFTKKQKIFVSIGLGRIEMDNEVYFAISPNVPIYKAMEGLKVGDDFKFRDEVIRIESIC
ncbi:MAG: hypothetical protein CVU00_04980 [Bacteroidetes bacterium HGW-Bacteroidetes-17]|jgi:predicted nuclease with TOPRIM domain|nr:MAG: hypothetical protein CVU00_04980 [Bacteroidetes bacterium HGW-Bacteroidetes-17]